MSQSKRNPGSTTNSSSTPSPAQTTNSSSTANPAQTPNKASTTSPNQTANPTPSPKSSPNCPLPSTDELCDILAHRPGELQGLLHAYASYPLTATRHHRLCHILSLAATLEATHALPDRSVNRLFAAAAPHLDSAQFWEVIYYTPVLAPYYQPIAKFRPLYVYAEGAIAHERLSSVFRYLWSAFTKRRWDQVSTFLPELEQTDLYALISLLVQFPPPQHCPIPSHITTALLRELRAANILPNGLLFAQIAANLQLRAQTQLNYN